MRAGAEADGFERRVRGLPLGAKTFGVERRRDASFRAIEHGIAAEPDHDVIEAGQALEYCRVLECARHAEADAPLDRDAVERNAGENHAAMLWRDEA